MKALRYQHYGQPDVLHLEEIKKPLPGENEILVRVHATTVNRTDSATIRGIPFFVKIVTGFPGPKNKTPGTEFAGVVEQAGDKVTEFKPGDRVFGFTDLDFGTHAEYAVVKARHAELVPEKVSFAEAAASSEGAHYAWNFIKNAKLNLINNPGKVLLNGASGGIGSAMVQLLKYLNINVTAVCGTKNVELVKSIGADRVIDFEKEDFTKDTERFDYVFDTVGKSSFFKCFSLLNRGGVYISSDLGYLSQNIFLPLITPVLKPLLGFRKTVAPIPTDIKGSLKLVQKLLREGKYKPVIDRTYPFAQIQDAYRYVQTGEKTGNVVIKMPDI